MSRPQTIREEKLNILTHGLMAILIAGAIPFAVVRVFSQGGNMAGRDAVTVAIFCLCLVFMFSTSAIYHSMPMASHKKIIFNRLDHMSIYFAIAGSYTPIAVSIIGGRPGLTILVVEWSLVLAGMLFKLFFFKTNLLTRILSVALYLAMGWSVVVCFPLLAVRALPVCLWLILAGGIFYTIGVVFFSLNNRYAHVVWHFFVNAGAISHFVAIVFFLNR